MSFGDNKPGYGEKAKISSESDIAFSNSNIIIMPSSAISQSTPTLVKSMFNSPALSLALVRF
jgi:hypothetical protein